MAQHHPLTPFPVSRGLTVWLTGLSGAGKTTLCEQIASRLHSRGVACQVLDGDVIRRTLWPDLGFSMHDRMENVRRLTFLAELLRGSGTVVLVAAIAPYRASRLYARQRLGRYLEVYVNAPVEVCRKRDPKGLYAHARDGRLPGLTGVDAPYETPETPDVECCTDQESVSESCGKVMRVVLRELNLSPD